MPDRRRKHECYVCNYTFFCRYKPAYPICDCSCNEFIHRGHTIFVCFDEDCLFSLNDKIQKDNRMTISDTMEALDFSRK